MKRITIEEVRVALAATGATLAPNETWNPDKRTGCPLGLLAVAANPSLASVGFGPVRAEQSLGLSEMYGLGFTDGFDGGRRRSEVAHHPNYDLGYADGLSIARVLTPDRFLEEGAPA